MSHTLHLGDCLEIMPMLEAGSVDAIISDWPYGTTDCSWDSVIPLDKLWPECKRVIKRNGAIVLFGMFPFTAMLWVSNSNCFRHEWTWDKRRVTGGANADKSPMRAHESVLMFSSGNHTYNPQMTKWTPDQIKRKRRHDFTVIPKSPMSYAVNISPGRDKQVKNGRHPDSIIRIPALGSRDPERTGHPTQKPVALLEYLILTYTNPGDLVLDNTFGSCTTGIGCLNLGRRFIGIEKDPEYFRVGEERMKKRALELGLVTNEVLDSYGTTDKDISGYQVGLPQLHYQTLCTDEYGEQE